MKYWLMLMLACATPAAAYTNGGSPLNLQIPGLGESGTAWSSAIRYDLLKLSTGVMPINGALTSTPTWKQIYVDTITARGSEVFFSSKVVMGSSVTVHGSLTASGSSITANAFFGNVSGLTGALNLSSATLTGTGAAVYSLTSSSGVHVLNGRVKLESGALVEWPDGTTQVTAPSATASVYRQVVSSSTTGVISAMPVIPQDTSTPQISEGGQILVATMTPTNAASRIIIRGTINLSERGDVCDNAVLCIFKDNNVNAISCHLVLTSGGPSYGSTTFLYSELAGSTTLRNYSIRAGGNVVNCVGVNEQAGAANFGGTMYSSMLLEEVAP